MTPQERVNAENHSDGACPDCGGCDGLINFGRTHVCFCKQHRTRWSPGSNLYSSWRHETEDEQREAAAFMFGADANEWRDVEPIYPERSATDDEDPFSTSDLTWFSDEDLWHLLNARSCSDMADNPECRQRGMREFAFLSAELTRRGKPPAALARRASLLKAARGEEKIPF